MIEINHCGWSPKWLNWIRVDCLPSDWFVSAWIVSQVIKFDFDYIEYHCLNVAGQKVLYFMENQIRSENNSYYIHGPWWLGWRKAPYYPNPNPVVGFFLYIFSWKLPWRTNRNTTHDPVIPGVEILPEPLAWVTKCGKYKM